MARERTGERAEAAAAPERRPYRRRDEEEWGVIRALYRRGATARALAERFGGTERTIYTHLQRHGCLRKAQAPVECALDEAALDEAVRQGRGLGRGCEAEAPCLALREDASLAEAARAAAETSIRMLRAVQPTRAYTFARLAGALERLARGAVGTEAGDADGTGRGVRAALDFLRREALAE